MEKYGYLFSFGLWNIHEGADPSGLPVRPTQTFDGKLTIYNETTKNSIGSYSTA